MGAEMTGPNKVNMQSVLDSVEVCKVPSIKLD